MWSSVNAIRRLCAASPLPEAASVTATAAIMLSICLAMLSLSGKGDAQPSGLFVSVAIMLSIFLAMLSAWQDTMLAAWYAFWLTPEDEEAAAQKLAAWYAFWLTPEGQQVYEELKLRHRPYLGQS
jgi:hypothetical protein